jgi:hypothetical protein
MDAAPSLLFHRVATELAALVTLGDTTLYCGELPVLLGQRVPQGVWLQMKTVHADVVSLYLQLRKAARALLWTQQSPRSTPVCSGNRNCFAKP